MSKMSLVCVSSLCLFFFAPDAQAQDFTVQRHSIEIQRDRQNFIDKGVREADTPQGRAIISAVAAYFDVDPKTVNGAITAAQNFLPARPPQDFDAFIQTPQGYTICYAKPVGPLGAGQHDIETHGGSTWNTTLLRVIPGGNQLDGLGMSFSVPTSMSHDARVSGTFDIVLVKADPGWQTRFKGCRPTGEHPWLARNNETRLNAACTVPGACAPPGTF